MSCKAVPILGLLLLGCTNGANVVHVAPPTGDQATDRANIIAAIEQVRPDETVQFAPGTYIIGEFITVPTPRVTLLGHPEGTTLRGCGPGAFDNVEEAMVACNGVELTGERQTVRALTFEYMWSALWVGCCLNSAEPAEGAERPHVGGHLIEGNTFRNSMNGFRVTGDSPEPVVIRDNDFVNLWHAGGVNGRTAHILDNRISVPNPGQVPVNAFPGLALFITPYDTWLDQAFNCTGNVIAGNRVEDHPEGISILIFRPGASCHDNVIRTNTIVVSRARFSGSPWGVLGMTNQADSTVAGVPIALVDHAAEMDDLFRALGVQPPEPEPGDGAEEELIYDNLIDGNVIAGAEGLGIEIRRGSRNRIVNNTITGVALREPFPGNTLGPYPPEWGAANGAGIWVSPGSDENEVVGNTFEDVASHAVVLEGDRNRVETRSSSNAVRDLGSGNRVSGAADSVAEVRALLDQFVVALNDESPGRAARFFADDAVLTLSSGAVHAGREAIVHEFLRPNVARIRGMRLTSTEMAAADGRVTVAGAYAARFAPAADTVRERLSTTWSRQQDGSWLIAASTFELPTEPADGPVRSRYFHSDGLRLHYLDFGGEGVPVVFMPVRDRTAYSFVEFAEHFADRHRVLAITSRGSGESEGDLEEVFDLFSAARDVIALLDAVGIERAVIIPWWWAQIGVYLAEQHPERVAGLVFPGGGPGPDVISLWDEDPTGVLEMAPRLFSAQDGEDPDEAMRKLRGYTRYDACYLRTGGSIGVPALMFVSETGAEEVAERWQGDLTLAREVAADPLIAPDSLARAFYLRLAADAELQEEVRAVYRDLVAPAYETAETAFRRAFGERLHIVPVDGRGLGYGYRRAPDLIAPHMLRFLDEIGAREQRHDAARRGGDSSACADR